MYNFFSVMPVGNNCCNVIFYKFYIFMRGVKVKKCRVLEAFSNRVFGFKLEPLPLPFATPIERLWLRPTSNFPRRLGKN